MTNTRLGFYGGVGTVTGANFFLETPQNKFLIDCGMFQGKKVCDDANYSHFMYEPSNIDFLLVTHAHLDHVGRIPQLVGAGFKGVIYSTPETRKLTELMLADAVHIIEQEAKECGMAAPYTQEDVQKAFSGWETVEYYTPKHIGDCVVTLKDAGHILGSSVIEITHEAFGKLVFTGDLGSPHSGILRDADILEDANYLVIESVYGDRVHEKEDDRISILEDVIEDIVAKKGTLLIPTFSIERTQAVLTDLNTLVENQRIPRVPVFLDSPLAIKVTEVYRGATKNFNKETQDAIASGDDIFAFTGLTLATTVEASKAINDIPGPKIILAGSGMSHGGRIIHHEKRYLSDSKNVLLIVGYQAAGSIGRQLQDGAKEITIGNVTITVRARIEVIHGYSGHRDVNGLLDYVSSTHRTLKRAFVTMGEPKASQFFVQRLRDYLGVNAILPQLGETFDLSE